MARNRRGFVAIPFTGQYALSTLASATVLGNAILTLGEDLFLISADLNITVKGLTAGEGPLEHGLYHGDLSVTEVAEALDAEVSDPDDIVAREHARRPVRRAGVTPGLSASETLKDGEATRVRCKFSVGDGHPISVYTRNQGGSALTTGATVEYSGTLYGRWQR